MHADFGDLTGQVVRGSCGGSNAVRALRIWILLGSSNVIDYVTIASLGNGTNFGDMPYACGYNVYGNKLLHKMYRLVDKVVLVTDAIDYVQIMSEGDAIDFGNITSKCW